MGWQKLMEKDVMNLARMIGKNNGERSKVLIVSNKQTFHYNMMKPVIIIANSNECFLLICFIC
jgi:hypothetical protein